MLMRYRNIHLAGVGAIDLRATVASYRIVRELGKLVGQALVPMGTSSYCIATEKGSADSEVLAANLFFLDRSLLEEARACLDSKAERQARELLSMYDAFRLYMSPLMWEEFFRNLHRSEQIVQKKRGVEASQDRERVRAYIYENMIRLKDLLYEPNSN